MEQQIKPRLTFRGTVEIPPDKSLTHRALFFSALSEGKSSILNPLEGEDCLSTARCLEKLGCKITYEKGAWTVESPGRGKLTEPSEPLDCGNSGTTMRLIMGVLVGEGIAATLIGDPSLSKRPMDRVAAPLKKMGASISLSDGRFPPVKIEKSPKVHSIQWENPVASAQVKSAVLLAALSAEGETNYREPSTSRDHTERMLAAMGVEIEQDGCEIRLKGPAPKLYENVWEIPGDFSSAAFFIGAGVLIPDSEILLPRININPTRTGMLSVLQSMGARIQIRNPRNVGGEEMADLLVVGGRQLRAARVDRTISAHLIDEIPILAVAATQARGRSEFSGLEELRVKESDRIKAIVTALKNIGARIEEKPDGFVIEGPSPLVGGRVDSMQDHRIAMAMGVAGLISREPVTIVGSEAVSISFPTFWNVLNQYA